MTPGDRSRPELGILFVPAAALTIAAALFFTFVATVAVIGPVRHARDQQTAFATFRGELANATAMVTQLGEDGKPQPLGRPMAVLDIPQIGLREVIFEGTSAGVMRSGPGHRRDTPLPGQAGTSIILGRRAAFGGPFAHLDQLGPKQVFSVTTGQGKSLYRIIGLRRAGDPQPPIVAAGKGRLILITTTGRPVFVGLIADGTTNSPGSYIGCTRPAVATSADFGLLRDSTIIARQQIFATDAGTATATTIEHPASSISHVDVPSAGTHTYKLTILSVSTTANVRNVKLIAYEL